MMPDPRFQNEASRIGRPLRPVGSASRLGWRTFYGLHRDSVSAFDEKTRHFGHRHFPPIVARGRSLAVKIQGEAAVAGCHDSSFTLYLNGKRAASGNDWRK